MTPYQQEEARKQTERLTNLMNAAARAFPAAATGDLFASKQGLALINAAFDLFEVKGLYDLRADVEVEIERAERLVA